MRTFQAWLAMRSEGLWLNDKAATAGLSNVSPLPPPKRVGKPKVPKFRAAAPIKPKQAAMMRSTEKESVGCSERQHRRAVATAPRAVHRPRR